MSSAEKQWYVFPRTFLETLQNSHLFQEEQTTLVEPEKETNVHETTVMRVKPWSDGRRGYGLNLAY